MFLFFAAPPSAFFLLAHLKHTANPLSSKSSLTVTTTPLRFHSSPSGAHTHYCFHRRPHFQHQSSVHITNSPLPSPHDNIPLRHRRASLPQLENRFADDSTLPNIFRSPPTISNSTKHRHSSFQRRPRRSFLTCGVRLPELEYHCVFCLSLR